MRVSKRYSYLYKCTDKNGFFIYGEIPANNKPEARRMLLQKYNKVITLIS